MIMSDNAMRRLNGGDAPGTLPLQHYPDSLVAGDERTKKDGDVAETNSATSNPMAKDESVQQNTIGSDGTGAHANINENENDDADEAAPVRVQVFWPTLQAAPTRDRLIVPPLNFAMVDKGVYRSGYPNRRNFVFLQSLGLKSILYLSPEKHQDLKIGLQNIQFISDNNLRLFHVGLQGQKEPFTVTNENTFREALAVVLDRRNHPLLIHCDKGKHRTGCLVACLRRLQGWSMASIFDEYARYCQGNTHVLDLQFIELVQLPQLEDLDPDLLPHWLLRDHR